MSERYEISPCDPCEVGPRLVVEAAVAQRQLEVLEHWLALEGMRTMHGGIVGSQREIQAVTTRRDLYGEVLRDAASAQCVGTTVCMKLAILNGVHEQFADTPLHEDGVA